MGWTFMASQGRDRVEIIRPLLDYETDANAQKVIDHAVIGTTVYLLVCRTPKGAWEPSTTYVNDADGSYRWICRKAVWAVANSTWQRSFRFTRDSGRLAATHQVVCLGP
jgi:hypothetical protein